MGEDMLSLSNILTVAGLAGGFLALAKHWYKIAQALLVISGVMLMAKIGRWSLTSDWQTVQIRLVIGVSLIVVLALFVVWAVVNARPKLTILFVPKTVPYDEPEYVGEDGDKWKTYRIAVTSSVPTTVIVRVGEVSLHGFVRDKVHLHYMHDTKNTVKRVELFKDVPDFWDVVQKALKVDHPYLTHIHENLPKDLPPNTHFKIVASSRDGSTAMKTAVVKVGADGELLFELVD